MLAVAAALRPTGGAEIEWVETSAQAFQPRLEGCGVAIRSSYERPLVAGRSRCDFRSRASFIRVSNRSAPGGEPVRTTASVAGHNPACGAGSRPLVHGMSTTGGSRAAGPSRFGGRRRVVLARCNPLTDA
jgi:hypothetical protein